MEIPTIKQAWDEANSPLPESLTLEEARSMIISLRLWKMRGIVWYNDLVRKDEYIHQMLSGG